jgi:hypothetical protein
MLMASVVMAQTEMCLYESGDCWPRSGDPGCQAHAWVFSGGAPGAGTLCEGGQFTGEGKSQTPPTDVNPPLGCCKWATTGECHTAYTAKEVEDCSAGENSYWTQACTDSPACPTTPPAYDGSTRPNHCKDGQGRLLFCQWDEGCYEVGLVTTGANAGKTCEQLIADCNLDGELYHSVPTSALNETNEYGKDVNCLAVGGTRVPFYNPDKCYDSQGNMLYCQWGGENPGCFDINRSGNASLSCADLVAACIEDGEGGNIYQGFVATEGNNYGTGAVCMEHGGVIWNGTVIEGNPFSTRICVNASRRSVSAPLRASYARGSISINWNAGSQIRSGTVSLINVKGATVASTSIRPNSSNISAKLGSRATLPAGMYFVRIDARDVNGKRIVQQVPVNIVK